MSCISTMRALERIEPPFLDLHAADWTGDTTYEIRGEVRRFENWEVIYAAKLGLGEGSYDWQGVGPSGGGCVSKVVD